jgi:hypothetical protein
VKVDELAAFRLIGGKPLVGEARPDVAISKFSGLSAHVALAPLHCTDSRP